MRVHDDGSVTVTKQEIMAMRQALLDEDVQEIRVPSLPVHVVTPNRRRRTIARCVQI
jgi:hypothetical protein